MAESIITPQGMPEQEVLSSKESKKKHEAVAEKAEKEIREALEGIKAELRKLPKLKAADFKKETAKSLEFIYEFFPEIIIANTEGARKNDKTMIELIGKRFKDVDKEFKAAGEAINEIYERLTALEWLTLCLEIRNREYIEGKPMSHEDKKKVASHLSIDWDKIVEEGKKNLAAKGNDLRVV